MDLDAEPAWLDTAFDQEHEKRVASETEPLFGSGKLPLDSPSGEKDEESQPGNYGAIQSSPDDNHSAAPSSKSGGGRSKASTKKSAQKQVSKNKNEPPKSLFDDDYEKPYADDSSNLSEDGLTTLTLDTKPHMPTRNWCLEFFRFCAGVTVIASLGLLATQGTSKSFSEMLLSWIQQHCTRLLTKLHSLFDSLLLVIPLFFAPLKAQGYFDLALKVYVALFCLLFILVECDTPIPLIRNSDLLQSYLSRGFLYSFLGLICLEEAYSERVKEMVSSHADEFHVAWASLFMQISSWLIFACGIFYMLMGLCCLKRLRDKIRIKDKDVWKKYRKDLKEWKRLNA